MGVAWLTIVDARRFVPAAVGLDDAVLLDGLTVACEVLGRLGGVQGPVEHRAVTVGCPCMGDRLVDAGMWPGASGSAFWWRVTGDGSGDLALGSRWCRSWLVLPSPASSVVSVTTDGTLRDAAEYEVRDGTRLVPLPGSGHWPGPVEVLYMSGGVGLAAQRAAAVLGTELAKASTGAADCALPKRVTSVARQGVSYTILDPQTFLTDGRTGLYDVDLWLTSLLRPAASTVRVLSPDRLVMDRRPT